MFRRLFLVCFVAFSLAGCLDTRKEKIYVRRVPPTKEELDAMPPPLYEDVLRRDDANRESLRIPLELHEKTEYLTEGRRSLEQSVRSPRDPWATYEADRIRVIQSRNWADVGKSPPPEVLPKRETPVGDDPFAPVAKMGKKKDAEGEAPAEGDKPAEGGDKPAEGEKKK